MGAVDLAEDTWRAGRLVALKTAPLTDAPAREGLEREFRRLCRLRHPNVVAVHDFGRCEATRTAWFTMEHADGRPFLEALAGAGEERRVEAIAQLCRALDFVHSRGLVHADVKSENVVLQELEDGDLRVVLVDFGLAATPEEMTRRAGGRFSGTLSHAAPELVGGAGAAGPASDLYALGVLLFELHAGRALFEERDPVALAEAHRRQEPPELAEACPELPVAARSVLARLLEKRPSARPPSALTVAGAFVAGREGLQAESVDSLVAHARAPRLVGQEEAVEAALALARAAADRAEAQARTLWVGGPAGTGKTRVLDQAAHEAQLLGVRVLRGRALGALEPYAGLDGLVVEAVRSAGEAVAHLLPELVKIAPAIGTEVEPTPALAPEEERLRLGAAAWEAFVAAAVRPLLLVLDDADRLSDEAGELLAYLVRRLELECEEGRRPPLAVLAAGRDLAGIVLSGGLEVRTRAFDRPGLEELLGLLFPGLEGAGELTERLHEELGGHPALTERWLEGLVREGALERGEQGWKLIPEHPALRRPPADLEEALVESLGELDQRLRELLVDVTLLPDRLEASTLARLGAREEGRQEFDLDRLEARELVTAPSRERGRPVSCASALVREAAGAAWPELRRVRAESLFERSQDETVLGHVDRASLAEAADRTEAAVTEWAAALEEAKGRGDHLRAGSAARRLAAVSTGEGRARALRAQARASLHLGRLEEAESLSEREDSSVVATEEDRGERLELLRDVAVARGRIAEAEARASELVELRSAPGEERWRALHGLAQIRVRDARREWSSPDPELVEQAVDADRRGAVAMLEGTAHLTRGRSAEAMRSLERALELLPEDGLRRAAVHNNLGVAALRLGRLASAARALREAIALRRRAGARLAMSGSLVNVALLELERSRPAAAVKSLREALHVKREAGDRPGALLALTNLVVAELQRCEFARALEALERARRDAAATEEARAVRVLDVLSAEICGQLGDDEGLVASLDRLQPVVNEPSFSAHRPTVLLARARLRARRGEREVAITDLRGLLQDESFTGADRAEAASVLASLLVNAVAARRAPTRPPAVPTERAREALERLAKARAEIEGEEGWSGIRLDMDLAAAAAHDALGQEEGRAEELAAALRRQRRAPDRLQRAELQAALGLAAARREDWAEAEARYAEALKRVRTVTRSVPPALREGFLADERRRGLREALLAVRLERRKAQEAEGFFAPLDAEPVPSAGESRSEKRVAAGQQAELRRLHEVIEITRDINALVPVRELLERILDRVLSLMQAERGFIVLAGADARLEFAAARDSGGRTLERAQFAVSRSVLDEVVRTGRPVLSSDARADERFVSKQSVLLLDLRSVLVAPLVAREEVVGALYVDNSQRAGAFGEKERDLLTLFAGQAAVAVENARLHETRVAKDLLDQELRIARGIQRRLLPERLPAPRGWRVAASMKPARELGGDYYDGLELGDGRARLAIGDVSGKGVPAGLVMVMAHAILREVAFAETPLDAILARANAALEERIEDDKFMTLALLQPEPGGRALRLSLAGHEPPLIWRRAGGSVETLEAGGIALGMLPDASGLLREDRLELEPGDVACCYTDGVTECLSPDGEMFGRERLERALADSAAGGAQAVVEEIESRLDAFRGSAERSDDVTLLVLEAGEAEGEPG